MSQSTLTFRPTGLGPRGLISSLAHIGERRIHVLAPALDARSAAATESTRRRGVWALMDQGVVSLGNCATNVLLMRGLAAQQFGVFSLLLEAMLFLNTLQAALVIYPLSVRGAVLDEKGLKRLAGACLVLTALIAIPLGLAISIAATVKSSAIVGLFTIGALLMWQCQETLRRAMMSHGGQKRCLPGDAISYLGQATWVFALLQHGSLNVTTAFATMALTSAAAVVMQSIQIGPTFGSIKELRETGKDFWTLGRWVMLGNLTLLITTLGCSWTLAGFHGATSVAQFQAMAGVLRLSNPMTICMAGLIVPAAARAFHSVGLEEARRVSMKYGTLTVAALAPYYLFLLAFPQTAIRIVCGEKSAYAELGNEMRAFVVWYSALLVGQIAGCYLNAIEQSRRSFQAQLAMTAATVLVTIPMTAFYGLDGMMLGGVISNLVMAAALVSLARRANESTEDAHTRFVLNEMRASAKAAG